MSDELTRPRNVTMNYGYVKTCATVARWTNHSLFYSRHQLGDRELYGSSAFIIVCMYLVVILAVNRNHVLAF